MDILSLRPPLTKMSHLDALSHIEAVRADRMVSKVKEKKAKKEKIQTKTALAELAAQMSPEELKGLMERLGKGSVRTT